MAWDFSTEPEFQEQLDWVEDFCRTEIEPLDLVFPGAAYSRNPKAKELVAPLKQQVRGRFRPRGDAGDAASLYFGQKRGGVCCSARLRA